MTTGTKKSDFVERSERINSHTVIEVRSSTWWPFGVKSGVLLDISESGCKIELEQEGKYTLGSTYWMVLPLLPLGIFRPKVLKIQIEIRWYDPSRIRLGAVFVSSSTEQKRIIEQIFDNLKNKR